MRTFLDNSKRFLETVRHLHAEQMVAQALHHSKRVLPLRKLWKVDTKGVTARQFTAWFPAPFTGCNSRESILEGRFTFIAHQENLGWPIERWGTREGSKLWDYNLQYFDWMWVLEPNEARQAALEWIGTNTEAWEPYPVSLRLMNWCGHFGTREWGSTRIVDSALAQTHWLSHNLETRLLANHYMENAAALVIAGCALSHPVTTAAFEKGLVILKKELPEQFPGDGMHFERSPMYHVRMTYVLSILCATGNSEVVSLVEPYRKRAVAALGYLTHPDGEIALLNDSAMDVYHKACEWTEGRTGVGNFALPDAGYYGHRGADGSYIIADFGALGPDYNLGHAHGDTFSFELSVGGKRIVTDTGVSTYEEGPERTISRATRSHNTVEVDGEDQAEFWSRFRVARRPKVEVLKWTPGANGFQILGEHDGYTSRKNPAMHRREIKFSANGQLELKDRVEAAQPCTAKAFLHFHPDVVVRRLAENKFECVREDVRVMVGYSEDMRVQLETSEYFPKFGTRVKRQCLVAESRESLHHMVTRLTWE